MQHVCPRCGATLSIPDSLAGKSARCPCGQLLQVPLHPATKACPYCAELINENAVKCKHCGENPSSDARATPTNILWLGLVGAGVSLLGVFTPVVSVPLLGGLNFFQIDSGFIGITLLLLAVGSAVLVFTSWHQGLWATGLGALALLTWYIVHFKVSLAQSKLDFQRVAKDNPFAQLGETLMDAVHLQWGLVVLVIGAILTVTAAVLAALRRQQSQSKGVVVWGVASVALTVLLVGTLTWAAGSLPHATSKNVASVEKPSSHAPEPAGLAWADASRDEAQLGDVRVRVTSARIRKIDLVDSEDERGQSKEDLLEITLTIKNLSRTRIIHYRSWGTAATTLVAASTLKDNLDNTLSGCHFGVFDHPVGQVLEQADLDPGKTLTDVLVFRQPLPKTKFLRLQLPGDHVGDKGEFRLQIPREMFSGKEVRPPKDPPPPVKDPTPPVKDPTPPANSVADLCKALKDSEVRIRRAAAYALGNLGRKAEAAVPDLAAATRDQDRIVRAVAAEALGKIGPLAKKAVTDLRDASKDAEPQVRLAALTALVKVEAEPTAVLPVLVAALKDTDKQVRAAALSALVRLDVDNKEKVQPFMEALKDSDAQVRAAAAAALGSLGLAAKDVLPPLVAALKDGNVHVRTNALESIGKLGPDGKPAISDLVAALDDTDVAFRKEVLRTLQTIGPEGVRAAAPRLAEMLKDKDTDLQSVAASALVKLGPDAKDAAPALAKLLKDGDSKLRLRVLSILEAIGPEAKDAVPAVFDLLQDKEVGLPPIIDKMFQDKLRFGQNGKHTDEMQERLSKAPPLKVLVKIGKPAVGHLRKLFKEDENYRLAAITALASIGTDAADAIPDLNEATKDRYQEIRAAARAALVKVKEK